PYDDSGWSQGPRRNVQTFRITDAAVLSAPMEKLNGAAQPANGMQGEGAYFAINNNATGALAALRFRLADVAIEAAEAAFTAGSAKFEAGTFLVPAAARAKLEPALRELGLTAVGVALPSVAPHAVARPRIAL